MLPPGHIAGGLLVAHELLKHVPYHFTPTQTNELLALGAFFAFAPDLDMFYAFKKVGKFRFEKETNHREFTSHAPILWLIAGLLVYFLSSSGFWKTTGLLIWLGSWSHFLLDTIEWGIMWFWPLSKKKFAWRIPEPVDIPGKGFWSYWWNFLKYFSKEPIFYLEIILIAITLVVIL